MSTARSAAALAAEACGLLGNERLALRFYELLLPRDGLCILGGRGVYFRGAAARYLGLLASTLGRKDDAVRHLEEALETNTRAQAPPWIARSQLELARLLLARAGPEDERRAVDLLQHAELSARQLGMRALAAEGVARTLRNQRPEPAAPVTSTRRSREPATTNRWSLGRARNESPLLHAVGRTDDDNMNLFVQIHGERQLFRGTSGGNVVQGLLTSRGVPVYAGGTAVGNKAVQLFSRR